MWGYGKISFTTTRFFTQEEKVRAAEKVRALLLAASSDRHRSRRYAATWDNCSRCRRECGHDQGRAFSAEASVTTTALFDDAIPVGIALQFIATRENAKDARDGLLCTRILATSYGGQLLEIMFTSNTDPNPALKDKIDKVILLRQGSGAIRS